MRVSRFSYWNFKLWLSAESKRDMVQWERNGMSLPMNIKQKLEIIRLLLLSASLMAAAFFICFYVFTQPNAENYYQKILIPKTINTERT